MIRLIRKGLGMLIQDVGGTKNGKSITCLTSAWQKDYLSGITQMEAVRIDFTMYLLERHWRSEQRNCFRRCTEQRSRRGVTSYGHTLMTPEGEERSGRRDHMKYSRRVGESELCALVGSRISINFSF